MVVSLYILPPQHCSFSTIRITDLGSKNFSLFGILTRPGDIVISLASIHQLVYLSVLEYIL